MEAAAIDKLRERFCELWCNGDHDAVSKIGKNNGATIFDALCQELNDSTRYYHSLNHVSDCLIEFDLIKQELENAPAVECAIWFHDYIIDPAIDDEESRSAQAYQKFAENRFSETTVKQVVGLIHASAHTDAPVGNDQQHFVDIDLSAIGAPWEKFSADSSGIRKESNHLSSEEYYRNNTAFLTLLVNRPRIYITDFFYKKYEAQARHNIARHIESLTKQGLLD